MQSKELTGEKIFVIDDNPDNLGVVAGYLKDTGYKVAVAPNGKVALERVASIAPMLILLDVKMPGMDGFEVCKKMKSMDLVRDIPIVFLTALNDSESITQGFGVGGSDYLAKPINKGELLARVKTHVENYRYKTTLKQQVLFRTSELEEANRQLHREVLVRKEIEEKLRVSGERLDLAMQGANDGVWDWNLKDNTVFFDSIYYTMAGYEQNEFSNTIEEWEKRVHPDDIYDTKHKLKEYLVNQVGANYHAEFRFLKKDNSYMWIRGKGHVVRRDPKGKPLRFVGTHSDITDLQETKKQLEESQNEYRQLYQQSPVMMHNIDMDGRITEVNEQWLETLGYKRDDVLGRCSYNFLTPESKQQAIKLFPDLYEKRLLRDCEYQFVTQKGEVRDVLLTAHMAKGSNDEWLGTRAAIVDITERNRIKGEKDKLVKQLHQSQKMEAIGTLAGGVAHDFNNILTAIFGFTELAKIRTVDDEATQKSLDHVLKSSERAKELVQHLLTFSRKAEVELQVLKIIPLLKETIKFIKATAPSTVDITYQVSKPESCLLADPTQMHQVFMNIFTNAVFAMKDSGGSLDIRIDSVCLCNGDNFQSKNLAPGEYVVITVSDTGYGIPKDKIEKIFDPFFTTKGKGEGTGLGLSVTYGIIHEMGGYISVYSEESVGTTFKIFLPEASGDVASLHESNAVNLTKGSGTILLVDDEPDIVEWMSDLLSQLGYCVIADNDPHNALELFLEDSARFDLVLTDLTMPKMMGTELAKRIHAVEPTLPIVLSTGFSPGLMDKTLEKNGIVELLMKPIIATELNSVVNRHLRKRSSENNHD